jgi:hypothetical protein
LIASTEPSELPINAALVEGWRLFLRSLPAIFFPVWLACVVDAIPGIYGGGGVLTGSIDHRAIIITIICWLVESALFGAAISRLDQFVRGVAADYRRALAAGAHATIAILIGDLLYNIVAWIGLLLFIVPGLILGTTLAFFAYAAVLDRKNVVDILGYSHALAWPHWGRSSVVLSAPAIVLMIYDVIAGWPDIMNAVQQLASGNLSPASVPSNSWYDLGLMPVVGGFVWCYVLAACYVQYRNLKQRVATH